MSLSDVGFVAAAPWETWADNGSEINDKATLREALRSEAAKWSLALYQERKFGSRSNEWTPMCVNVIKANIGSSGGCRPLNGYARVYVNQAQNPQRQRYTVAHELGHLFLRFCPAKENLNLTVDEQEAICDEFASHLLVSRVLLKQRLLSLPCFKPETLSSLANDFRVNLTPMVIALAEFWNPDWGILILAKERAHPGRPGAITFRVEAAAATVPWFLPRHANLVKLGLGDALETLDADVEQPNDAEGEVSRFCATLWEPGKAVKRSGRASGNAKWVGRRFGPTAVLVVQPTEIEYRWYDRVDSAH